MDYASIQVLTLNNPDMMVIGNGMPLNEQRAHFTMWAMINAPLMAGNDLRNIPAETRMY